MFFKDQMGNAIEMDTFPERIISIVPSQTELLYDLGLEDKVVGITKFCVRPAEWFRKKTRVGGTKKLNADRIKLLRPDLIIGNREENDEAQVRTLMQRHRVWMSDVRNLSDAVAMIRQTGSITGRMEKAEALAAGIQKQFERLLLQRRDEKNKPRVLYMIWSRPYMIVGRDTFIDDMLRRCGLNNAGGELKDRYPRLTPQQIAEADPDIFFLSSEPYPFGEKHVAEFAALCPRAKIRLVNGEMFSWYGSRLLKAPDYFMSLLKALNLRTS